MDIDAERSSRKRSAEVTREEVRSKVLAVDPHSKNNFSNNASESHLGFKCIGARQNEEYLD